MHSEKDLASAVHEIYRWWREGAQVIAVVSAFGETTDQLMRRAETICEKPDKAALATLLATGEATSSALLSLALNRVGIPARLLDEVQAGLRTVGGGVDAVPVAVDAARLRNEFRGAVVVLPGFVGRGEGGDKTLLGRGGSDLTALFLAHHLRAQCVLIKDVDGLYTGDPATASVRVSRFAQANYETAVRLGGNVVQAKAVRFAGANKLRFAITRIGAEKVTEVGPFADQLDGPVSSQKPLRVALLGCGTVGGGVFQRLAALPSLFDVVGVGTRTCMRARESGVPDNLNTDDLDDLLERDCDVVVELIGTTKYASALATTTLRSGRHFVTANKALIAGQGELLSSLAAACGGTLRYSAAVGGVLPALEAIGRARDSGAIKSFSGILNGTTNYVLDRLGEGKDLQTAVAAARQAGYAEANPQFDLNGTDAAQKLILLTRKAFDVSLPFDEIERIGIDQIDSQSLSRSRARGQTIRLVAECSRTGDFVKGSVKPVELMLNHPLAQVTGAENRLIITPEGGERIVVSGTGAGRWPTTEAVMADLFDIRRQRQSAEELEGLEARVA